MARGRSQKLAAGRGRNAWNWGINGIRRLKKNKNKGELGKRRKKSRNWDGGSTEYGARA
jgi:hypothetical protein